MTTPSISVVIAVYNGEKFIAGCLESLLAQTVPVAEILVIDDGSSDGTVREVERIASPLITLVRLPHHGVVAARSKGIRMATGDWVGFCDADDRWLPTKLEEQLRRGGEADLIHCNAFVIRNGKRDGDWWSERKIVASSGTGKTLLPLFFQRNQVNTSSVLVRRVVLARLFEVAYDSSACLDIDYPAWLYLLEVGARYVAIDACLVECIAHDRQLTKKLYLNKIFQEYALRSFLKRNPSFAIQHPWLVRVKFWRMTVKMAIETKRELGQPFPGRALLVAILEIVFRGWPSKPFGKKIEGTA